MGTRADFYVGRDEKAEWIGSIAWDGYRDGISDAVLNAASEDEFCAAVTAFFHQRDDVSLPADGWPWPWNDSGTTDCSYWFFDGQVWDEFGGRYFSCREPEPDDDRSGAPTIIFPDMSSHKSVVLSGSRSGLIVFGA